MASRTPESRNTVNLEQSDFMNGNECAVICIFNTIMSKSQVDSLSTITLLLGELTTGIPDLMASFGKISPILIERSASLELISVSLGRSQANSSCSFLQPILIVVRIMDHLHSTSRCWKISTTTKNWTCSPRISWIRQKSITMSLRIILSSR